MADYNLQGDSIVQGKNCIVRAGADAASAKPIGLVQDFEMRAQFQTQKAEVLGEFLPVAIDITGVSVSTTFSGFVPAKGFSLNDAACIKELNPNIDTIVEEEKTAKIPYLELYDKKAKAVIASTTWAILNSYSERSSGKGYMIANCSFESIGFFNGSDYPNSDLYNK